MTIRRLLLVAAIGLGCVVSANAQETVRIGVIMSLSGPAGAFGIPERDAMEILAKRHNETAGIKYRYELTVYDDQSNPTEAARGATKLIEQDKVIAILGATTGSSTLALMPIAAKAQVPVFSPISTVGAVAKSRDFFPWIFRTMPSDEVSQRKQFQQVVLKSNYKRMAIFHQEDAFGKYGADFATNMAKESGVEIVSVTSAPATAIDVTAAAIKIRNSKPDVVLLQVFAPALGAAFMRAKAQVGLNAPIAASGGLNQRAFFDLAGPAASGVLITGFGNWDAPSDRLMKLKTMITDAGKQVSGFGEILGATAFAIFDEAVRKVEGQMTGQKIRDAAEKICDFDGTYMEVKVCYSADSHEGLSADATLIMVHEDGKLKTIFQ